MEKVSTYTSCLHTSHILNSHRLQPQNVRRGEGGDLVGQETSPKERHPCIACCSLLESNLMVVVVLFEAAVTIT